MPKRSSNKSSDDSVMITIRNDLFKGLEKSQKITSISQSNPSKPIDEKMRKWDVNDKIVNLFEESINNESGLKKKYAVILIIILALQLVLLNVIFILAGVGILHYSDVTFNIFISGGLAEVFVLVRVIVKHLFNNNLAEALKIILDRNNQKINNYNKNNNKKKNDSQNIAN